MRVIPLGSPGRGRQPKAHRAAPAGKRGGSGHPIGAADAHFLASPFVIRKLPGAAARAAAPDSDGEDGDLCASLYSRVGRPAAARARTPALDLLREAIARGAQPSVRGERRLSAHLCPDVPMRYCPEIAFAERPVQKPTTKWPDAPPPPGRNLTRLFPKQLRRRPRSEYARSERSFDERSSAARSAFY
jgi:hypothetical protein